MNTANGPTGAGPRFVTFGEFRFDRHGLRLERNGETVPVAPKPLALLRRLLDQPGEVALKDELIEVAWGDVVVSDGSLAEAMRGLRHALDDDSRSPTVVETVHGRGYRFVAKVSSYAETAQQDSPGNKPPYAKPVGTTPSLGRRWLVAGLVAVTAAGLLWLGSEDEGDLWRAGGSERLTRGVGLEYSGSISSDGRQLVYASGPRDDLDIFIRNTQAGSAPRNLTEGSPGSNWAPVFDPDDDRLAFASDRSGSPEIYVMNNDGTKLERLAAGADPTWSPDGRRIAYSSASFRDARDITTTDPEIRIYDFGRDEQDQTIITTGFQPVWSPGGERIAYFALEGGNRDIYTVGIENLDVTRVTEEHHLDWSPMWSPDGEYLFFSSSRAGSDGIWRVRIDERTGEPLAGPQHVHSPGAQSPGHMSISDDGHKLLYTALQRDANIKVAPFDPSATEPVGQIVDVTSGARRIWWFDVSPLATKLIFADMLPHENLFTIGSDGANEVPISEDLIRDRRPRWSPLNDRIAVYSDRSGDYEMWTMDPDGNDPIQHTESAAAWWPTWSPDGTRLAFWAQGNRTLQQGGHIVDATLPHDEQTPMPLPAMDGMKPFFPNDWAGNPDRLLGGMGPLGDWDGIWVYHMDTEEYERVADEGDFLHWLPDGQRFLYARVGQLWLADSRSPGSEEMILDLLPKRIVEPKVVESEGGYLLYFALAEPWEADIFLLTRVQGEDR